MNLRVRKYPTVFVMCGFSSLKTCITNKLNWWFYHEPNLLTGVGSQFLLIWDSKPIPDPTGSCQKQLKKNCSWNFVQISHPIYSTPLLSQDKATSSTKSKSLHWPS